MAHPPGSIVSPVNQHRPRAGGSSSAGGISSGRAPQRPRTRFGGSRGRSTRPPSQASQFQDLLDQLAAMAGGGGGGGGGGGAAKQKIIDLEPFKNKELEAMRELLKQQTAGQRTELTGDRARIGNAFQRFEALRNKKLRDSLQQNRGSASRRGFLDSGIFLKDTAEFQNVAAGDISSEDVKSTSLINALSRQIGGEFNDRGRGSQDFGTGTLEALRSAQEASSTAEIERSFLNARISQGGQG